ncbi:MAG: 2-dehydropantoate 2-reductase [Deltaproteobacteria bacterium]|nr:2-dehydropantoate 2-reductase [Deltaproteobacteria bacterium]
MSKSLSGSTESIERIHIIGAGAVGAAYASIFYDMDPSCVSFIADGERCERLRREGVIVNGKTYPIPVLNSKESFPAADLLIVTVKHHHLDQAIEEMKSGVGKNTIIISLMNGIDSEERIGAIYGAEKILYATVVGIDALREGNNVIYTTQGKIFFGEKRNPVLSDRVRRVRDIFNSAGIIHEIPADMIRILWWKFMINVGINQASAALKGPYGVFQTSVEAQSLMEASMREVIALAQKLAIDLSDQDIEKWYAVLASLSPTGKTSMLQDVEAGRKTEVEMLAGKITELGRKHGVPTPVNEHLLDTIKKIESINQK